MFGEQTFAQLKTGLRDRAQETELTDRAQETELTDRAQELCESRGGRPGLPVPNTPTVSVDVKQHLTNQG